MNLLGWEGIRLIGILQAACLNGFSCIWSRHLVRLVWGILFINNILVENLSKHLHSMPVSQDKLCLPLHLTGLSSDSVEVLLTMSSYLGNFIFPALPLWLHLI